MKKLTIIIIILSSFLFSKPISKPNPLNIPWGTTYKQIFKKHRLRVFNNKIIKKNLNTFFNKTIAKKIKFYKEKKNNTFLIGKQKFTCIYGFYNKKLVSTILYSTKTEDAHPMPSKNDPLFSPVPGFFENKKWNIISKENNSSKNIFNQSGYAVLEKSKKTYNEFQICTGTKKKSSKIWYVKYSFDRNFFDKLTWSKKFIIDNKLKKNITSQLMFSRLFTKKDLELISIKIDKINAKKLKK